MWQLHQIQVHIQVHQVDKRHITLVTLNMSGGDDINTVEVLMANMEDDMVDDIKRVVRQAVALRDPNETNLARQIKESLDNEIVLEDVRPWNCVVMTRDGESNYWVELNPDTFDFIEITVTNLKIVIFILSI